MKEKIDRVFAIGDYLVQIVFIDSLEAIEQSGWVCLRWVRANCHADLLCFPLGSMDV